jgi:hypothetical protein
MRRGSLSVAPERRDMRVFAATLLLAPPFIGALVAAEIVGLSSYNARTATALASSCRFAVTPEAETCTARSIGGRL